MSRFSQDVRIVWYFPELFGTGVEDCALGKRSSVSDYPDEDAQNLCKWGLFYRHWGIGGRHRAEDGSLSGREKDQTRPCGHRWEACHLRQIWSQIVMHTFMQRSKQIWRVQVRSSCCLYSHQSHSKWSCRERIRFERLDFIVSNRTLKLWRFLCLFVRSGDQIRFERCRGAFT